MKVSHNLIKEARMPVFENVILNVSTAGDDMTGGLEHPFRQPQAALNWAMANLDFRNVEQLRLSLGAGQFDAMTLSGSIQGLNHVRIEGVSGTNVSSIRSFMSNTVVVSNLNFNGSVDFVLSADFRATIILSDNISFNASSPNSMLISTSGFAYIYGLNASITASGTFRCFLNANLKGVINLESCTVVVNGIASDSTISAALNSIIRSLNTAWSGSVMGLRFRATFASIITTGNINAIPGNADGENSDSLVN